MKDYTYRWLHIPTNQVGKSQQKFQTRLSFLEALNKWNKQQPRVWKYWY